MSNIYNQLADRVKAGENEQAVRAELGLPTTAPKPAVGYVPRNKEALLVTALMSEGLSENQAKDRLTRLGVEAFGPQIERQKAAEEANHVRREALLAADHPDERKRAAVASMVKKDKLAQDAVLAREWLATSGQGFSQDDVDFLSDTEVVSAAFGSRKEDTLADNLAAVDNQ